MSDMDSYRDVFLAESADYLQGIIDGLLELERSPDDTAPVELVFRGAHSLKGMSAAMGYNRTADLTHKMEGVMSLVRDGARVADRGLVELMLAAVDLVRDLIDDESTGGDAVDPTEMIEALEAVKAAPGAGAAGSEPAMPDSSLPVEAARQTRPGETVWRVTVTLEEGCVLKAVRAYMVIKRFSHVGTVLETEPTARDIEDERFDRTFVVIVSSAVPPDVLTRAALEVLEVLSAQVEESGRESVAQSPMGPASAGAERKRRELPKLTETQTVRVSIGHLDTLVDLVGELVILRSRLERLAERGTDPELVETLDDLQRISTDLQYEVMQTRMVPVGNIFNRFPRMVRDLSVDLGKDVEFAMDGLDIELDRTVLDEIGDPLVHLLRNSIDHGIEPPEQRVERGKARAGCIRLSASRERDHVAITVSDDGKGIDPDAVWSKACQLGLAHAAERAEYTDSEVLLLTCAPGFSTVDHATKVSGRGVGMDAVKGKIEHLGGTVRIDSRPGRGTDFVLRLPFTLAILHALLVDSGEQTFAVPLSSVEEVFGADEVAVDTIDGALVAILRDGEVVPLQRLDALLFGADPRARPEPDSSIVLMSSGSERRALHVDRLCGRQEIVIKPLSAILRDSRGFSGATILGDGRVLLIIDPRSIFTLSEA